MVVLSGFAATPVTAGPAPDHTGAAAPADRPHTVTLVSGDRVTIPRADATTATIEPAAGRERMSFTTSVVRGHLHVVPGDAAPMLRAQQLDRRLFDVTELVALGYDDAQRPTVPMIVRYRSAGTAAQTKRALAAAGGRTGRDLPAVRGVAVSARKDRATTLWEALTGEQRPDVQHVWLDGRTRPTLDVSVPQIGAPGVWQAGYTGKGMAVAVLDSGVDETHPDLAGKVTSRNFTTEATAADVHGHGTHVASTIAGTGAASGGKYKGVAPEATILNGKVCEPRGCTDSAVLAGMQWAAVDRGARIINLSLGGTDYAGVSPLEEAVNTLSEQTGALFVIAAGNNGADETIDSPGSADAALTVGAVDESDRTAEFSSRGPRSFDAAIKPDIAAPGVDIVAARSSGSTIGQPAADFPGTYQSLQGTSMATPHVAGAAALLAQQHPDWDGARLKSVLMASAKPDPAAHPFEQGAGRVDLSRAGSQAVTSEPASVSFGLQHWPHDRDTALTRTVTYHNTGVADVQLHLALTGDTTTVFRLSETTLTVRAGDSASVTLTADTTGPVSPGGYAGRIIATAGDMRVSTPIAIEKEDERYALTLRNIGLDGNLAANTYTEVFAPGGDFQAAPWHPSGEVTIRVPRGRYAVQSTIDTSAAADGTQTAAVFQPVIEVAADTTVTLDARKAARVSQAVPDSTVITTRANASVSMNIDGNDVAFGVSAGGFPDMRLGLAEPAAPGLPAMSGVVFSGWARKGSGPGGVNSPYAYYAAEFVPGSTLVAGGYQRVFNARELASEVQTIHGHAKSLSARQTAIAIDDTGSVIGTLRMAANAPATRVNFYTTGPAVRWALQTQVGTADEQGFLDGPYWSSSAQTHRANSTGRREWGAAPYGVAFSPDNLWISRRADTIVAVVPQVGDAAGHVGFDNSQAMFSRLYRDGELIGDYEGNTTGASDLPDAESTYRVEQTMAGPGYAGLATEKTVVFTFRSARPATDRQVALPALAVRYQPSLDASGSVRGKRGDLPLWVQDQTGKKVSARTLGAELSFDDGKTWRAVPVAPNGTASVTYPNGKGFVSVRLNAADGNGTAVTQTVIRAYRFS
ncbi:subtilase family protein [Actinoplanes xinjiangensis]|uniref:Subtilase family protein n=1 Tax=Actinoplanes xinjiangensis TaxID=512350 RepID=A0A316FD07_9ACTN|nr:subtilase family protein [Actinoplanes xinjiangensis]GIF40762.1 serine protease [Actinoplanes xinjiangensis]